VRHSAAHLTQKHPLKGYDAIQLAAGLELNASLSKREMTMVFVSGDQQLFNAAQAEGLTADNPFNHV
jgi:predicted nucleic acid-binding protein